MFRRAYADEHPLALEVDVSDGELAGERHGCGDECVCVCFGKVRAHLLSVFTIVESTPPTPAILCLSVTIGPIRLLPKSSIRPPGEHGV